MSAASADFVAATGDTIQFIFTPQTNGFAYFAGASVTVESSGDYTALAVANNNTSFKLPKDDSFIQIAIVDGPVPESGTLSYSVNGAASIDLWTKRPLLHMPGAFFGFGS
jgi:hypothetical protein